MSSYDYAVSAASWLDSRLPGWARRMIRSKEWRQSTALSIGIWVVSTFVVYELIEGRDLDWKAKVAVALAMDALLYMGCKFGVWPKRQVTVPRSYSLWFVWWVCFLGVNSALAWALIDESPIGTFWALVILGAIGIGMNPVVYHYRDRVVFPREQPTTDEA
jgi:hypothetical protein